MTTTLSLTHEWVTMTAESLFAEYGVGGTKGYLQDADAYISEVGVEGMTFPTPAKGDFVGVIHHDEADPKQRAIILGMTVPADEWSGHPNFVVRVTLLPESRVCLLLPRSPLPSA